MQTQESLSTFCYCFAKYCDFLSYHKQNTNSPDEFQIFFCLIGAVSFYAVTKIQPYISVCAFTVLVGVFTVKIGIVCAVNSGTDNFFGVLDAFPDFGGDYGYRFIVKFILILCIQRHCLSERSVFVHALYGITLSHGADVFVNLVFDIVLFKDEKRHSGGNIVFLQCLVDTENICLLQIGKMPLHSVLQHGLHNDCVYPWLVIMKKTVEILFVLFRAV